MIYPKGEPLPKPLLLPTELGLMFNFGRHAGRLIQDVPTQYLQWCVREIIDAPAEVVDAWRCELELRKYEGVLTLDFGE
jgi:uncharacterized protein (DUF3820 family)